MAKKFSPVWIYEGLKRRFKSLLRKITRFRNRIKFRLKRETLPLRKPTSFPASPKSLSLTGKNLYIGNANFAGQGYAWARAAEKSIPGLVAENITLVLSDYNFDTDTEVSKEDYWNPQWRQAERKHIADNFSHILIEARKTLTCGLLGKTIKEEAEYFHSIGKSIAFVSHGSDTRIPSEHYKKYPNSPFKSGPPEIVESLELSSRASVEIYNSTDFRKFVSTPDLIDYIPSATWLPVVVDTNVWRTTHSDSGIDKEKKLRILYAPTRSWLKGGEGVSAVLNALGSNGIIEVLDLAQVPSHQMPALVKSADIVIDQFALGAYGAMAVQAMAAGKVVVGHVAPWVRDRIPGDVPIVESNVDQLESVILNLVSNEELRRELGANGEQFVTKFHDGSYSGAVLKSWISPES